MIIFEVPGKPQGKQRPKFARKGKFTQAYTPDETVMYENLIKIMCKQSMQKSNQKIALGPVHVGINAYYYIPKSTSNKKRAEMLAQTIRPDVKPDLDNVIKVVLDAINAIAFLDDKQVIQITAEKFYSENPRVEVLISDWGYSGF